MAAEAYRLIKLSDSARRGAIIEIFTQCGLQLAKPISGADGYALFHSGEAEGPCAAGFVPAGRKASAVDVREIEAWRVVKSAHRALLISTDGFSPAAVRLAQHLPLTLVDPYLLAQWKHTGKM